MFVVVTKKGFFGFKWSVWASIKVDTGNCTSLFPVSVAWVNWNDLQLVNIKSIDDLCVYVKQVWPPLLGF